MGRISIHASALAAALLTFAVTGGIQASEQAVRAQEQGATPAAARTDAAIGVDAQIPFANSGNIRDWRPDGMDALYVQDGRGRWYRAALIGACVDLPNANQVAFLTQGPDVLDKFSAISVRGKRCPFSALLTSAAPPNRGAAKMSVAKA